MGKNLVAHIFEQEKHREDILDGNKLYFTR